LYEIYEVCVLIGNSQTLPFNLQQDEATLRLRAIARYAELHDAEKAIQHEEDDGSSYNLPHSLRPCLEQGASTGKEAGSPALFMKAHI